MLHFSRLKTALIIGVCLVGALLAVPNFIKPGVLPAWVPQPRVNLGLDLQGGSYLLLEVDLKTVLKERLVELRSEVVQALVKARVPHGGVAVRDQGISIDLAEADVPAARKALADVLAGRTAMSAPLFIEAVEGSRLTLTLSPAAIADLEVKDDRAIGFDRSPQDRRNRRQRARGRPPRPRSHSRRAAGCLRP